VALYVFSVGLLVGWHRGPRCHPGGL